MANNTVSSYPPDMAIKLIAEQDIRVGEATVVKGASPTPPFVVVFEDDGSTGYFYALDTSRPGNPIVDAMHIYNVASVTDRHVPSKVQIVWSQDDKKAALLINRHPHVCRYWQRGQTSKNSSLWVTAL